MTTKKLIIISIIIIILALTGYFVYSRYFKTAPSETNNTFTPGPSSPQKFFPLSKEKTMAATIDGSGKKVKYYSLANGNIYEANFDGSSLVKTSTASLAGVLSLLWSPDKNEVIGFFQEGDKIKKYLHDYQQGQSTTLNDQISQAVWSPDGKQIATASFDSTSGNNSISLANADGSNLKSIFQTRLKDLVLEWPTSDKISVKTPASGLSDGLVFTINPTNGSFAKVLNGLYGLNIKWSPLGDKILYSNTDTSGKNISLSLADQSGQNRTGLGVATLVEKCVFSQNDRSLFCAVPQTLSANAVWPDDYYKGLVATKDIFYKINLESGQKDQIFDSSSIDKTLDATNLFLSPQEDYLFFTNKRDGMLYGLKLE